MSFGLAKFPFLRDLGDFGFGFGFGFATQLSFDRAQIRDLAAPGAGKAHLAMTLVGEAIIAGHVVL